MEQLRPALDHFRRLDPSGRAAAAFIQHWNQALTHPAAISILEPPLIALGWWVSLDRPEFFVRFVFGPGAMERVLDRFEADARSRGIDPSQVRILYGRSRWKSESPKAFSYSSIKRHFCHELSVA